MQNSAQALQALQSFQGSEQSPDQLLTSQETSLGVPGAQQQVSGLRQAITNTTNLLNQVAPSVYGRTQNSLVTSAQAGRQISNEQAPIQQNLTKLGGQYTDASSDYKDLLGKASTLAGLQATGQQTKESNLKDIYTALYGQEQDTKKAAADAAAADEAKREFNVSASQKASSGGSGGLSASQSLAQSEKASQINTVQAIKGNLDKSTGRDGYVSPQSYAAAAKDWTQAGYSLKDFTNYFGQYKNPQNPYYAI